MEHKKRFTNRSVRMKSTVVVSFILMIMISVPSVCSAIDLCYENIKKKRYDDAIKECTRQINRETDVDDVGIAYANRGLAYAGKGLYDLAIADYDTAIKAKPGYEKAYFNRGNAYYAKGQYEEAIDDYTKAIELNPQNPYPHYNMACIYSVRACEQLRKSVEKGFKDWDSMEKDEDLDTIRSSPCYKEIMRKK
jgi:tetratricopeptide (TPR) repeat protein